MSFIRPLSNPEELFAWLNVDKEVEFTWIDRRFDDQEEACCPFEDLRNLIQKMGVYWSELGTYEYCFESGVLLVLGVAFDGLHAEIISKDCWKSMTLAQKTALNIDMLVCLKIGTKQLLMWKVTWVYFIRNVREYLDELERPEDDDPDLEWRDPRDTGYVGLNSTEGEKNEPG